MEVKELSKWLQDNMSQLQTQLLSGGYTPQAVRKVEIPKLTGGVRELGIPTVIDRLVQQAIHQVLSPRYELIFSENSYGFRPHRNAHQAVEQAGKYVSEGRSYVIDLDLEKFFDKVNHDRLMWLLSTRIGDKRLLKLIRKILQSGILEAGIEEQRVSGTPQGSPISPLLSNIVLDELDKELSRRGHSYVRYADDVKIFVKSEAAAERAYRSIVHYIEDKLLLKVNKTKSRICKSYELNFLGYSILRNGRPALSKESERKLKAKVKEITSRKRGISLKQLLEELQTKLRGWLTYFSKAHMKHKIERLDGWIKRRIRCFRLKQCKRTIGVVRLLRSLGVKERLSWQTALSGKGWWRKSNTPAVNIGMNNLWLIEQGYYSLELHYKKLKH